MSRSRESTLRVEGRVGPIRDVLSVRLAVHVRLRRRLSQPHLSVGRDHVTLACGEVEPLQGGRPCELPDARDPVE